MTNVTLYGKVFEVEDSYGFPNMKIWQCLPRLEQESKGTIDFNPTEFLTPPPNQTIPLSEYISRVKQLHDYVSESGAIIFVSLITQANNHRDNNLEERTLSELKKTLGLLDNLIETLSKK